MRVYQYIGENPEVRPTRLVKTMAKLVILSRRVRIYTLKTLNGRGVSNNNNRTILKGTEALM